MAKSVKLNGQMRGQGSYSVTTRALLKKLNLHFSERNYDTLLQFCPPNYFQTSAAKKVGMVAFEGSAAPLSWIQAAKGQDELITFSQHNVVAFKLPMHVMKPPVDLDRFTLGQGSEDKKTFLFVGQVDERKGLEDLIEAWKILDEPDYTLILHLVKVEHGEHEPVITHVKLTDMPKNVKFTDGLLSDSEIVKLYQSADFYVLPTRAEGFQQTSLEALACGCNVIITDEPSATCLKRRSGVWFIRSHPGEPSRDWCNRNADGHYAFDWYYIDPANLAEIMRHVAKAPIDRKKCNATACNFSSVDVANELWKLLE